MKRAGRKNTNPIMAAAVFFAAVAAFGVIAALGVLYLGVRFLGLFISAVSVLAAVLFVTTAFSVFFGAPFVPTDDKNVDDMLELAGLKPGERLADLGAGDGRIIRAAASRGFAAEGWEVNPYLWLWSCWAIRAEGLSDKAIAHVGSYWNVPMNRFDVVTLFLIDSQMERMGRKLRAELKPGSRVISYIFKFPNWQPVAENGKGVRVYKVGEGYNEPAKQSVR